MNKKLTGGIKRGGCIKKFKSDLPLISIITVVHNAKNKLQEVIKEVKSQTYSNKEHIIIDGGSDDGTLDVLRKNDGNIDYWISETDTGIYDAMNKGIEAADGEWLYFLGVDDVFDNRDTLKLIFKDRAIPVDIAMLLGNVIYSDGKLFKSRFGKSMYFKNTIHHQGVFYRYNVFEQFRYGASTSGNQSTKQYRISGDYQLNFLLFLQRAKHIYVNKIIAKCGSGISMQGNLSGYIEEIFIRHEHIGFFKAIFFDTFTFLRYFYKKILKTRD